MPPYNRPIFALDNSDPEEIRLRYKKDQLVIRATDSQARGAVCFLPDDFAVFMESMIGEFR